jgi:replicative DNA helicase
MNGELAQTERELLGHILSNNNHFHEAAEHLVAGDFRLDSHRVIFSAIAQLVEVGQPADLITLGQKLTAMSSLNSVGGMAYVSDLTTGLVFNRSGISSHVDAIRRESLRWELSGIAQSLISAADDGANDPEELVAMTEERLLELRARTNAGQHIAIAESAKATMDAMRTERARSSDLLGLSTGLPKLDQLTRGIQKGEYTVVGSGSGCGKTSFLTQVTVANCSVGIPVQIFSLEMTREQLLRRILAIKSGVPFFRVRDPRQANDTEMNLVERAANEIAKWPLYIEDAAGLTISKIVAKARLAVRRHGVKLVGVDYAQIVNAPGKDERLRVASISRSLTALAKDEQVPVIALSQLARADRSSGNRRPRMSDLRESSQLENDAHLVILLHREADEEFGKLSTAGELIIAKQRSGETGAFPIIFDKRSLTFSAAA